MAVICNPEFILSTKEVADGKKFLYTDIGKEDRERTAFRLWVHPSLATYYEKHGYYILKFPVKGARVDNGQSPYTKILRPDPNLNVFYIVVNCGYRGDSSLEVMNDQDVVKIDSFDVYESPRGNLGISAGALVTTRSKELIVKWYRTGRLYDEASEGITIVKVDGRCENFEEIENLSELDGLEVEVNNG